MRKWKLLSNNDSLRLEAPGQGETICFSAWYKMRLKRFASDYDDDNVFFKDELSYIEQQKIINVIRKNCMKHGAKLEVSPRILNHIASLELHVEERSRAGLEMKHQNKKYIGKFLEYSDIVNQNMERKLRKKQMWDSFYMCMMKKSANFSVPGSGKTSAVLGVYAFLKKRQNVKRIVVICPKNAFGSWIDEFEICFGFKEQLREFHLHDKRFKNTAQYKEELIYRSENYNLLLFNYESVQSYVNELKALIDEHTLLVYDEVHKVKKVGGKWASFSLDIARNASYCIVMTGTPIPNTYLDIYNILNILYPHEYNSFFNFDTRILRNPREKDIDAINEKIAPFFCRTTKQQLLVPLANDNKIITIKSSETENKLFNILSMKYRSNTLALMIRVLQLESDSSLLLNKLDLRDYRYLLDDSCDSIEEIDYVDYSKEVKTLITSAPESEKLIKCVSLAEKLVSNNKPTIIWCIFVNSMKNIAKRLEKKGVPTKIINGEVSLEDRRQILDDFKRGIFKVLITNPHTLAESISLHSVCHDAIYFEYSYNLVHLLQSKDRIHRLGLPENQYTQYYFFQTLFNGTNGEFSMDKQIYIRLKEKEQRMFDAIDRDVLETMPTNDEDLIMIFSQLF